MDTNFFRQVAGMGITGDLQLTIRQGADNNWVVSVLLQNEQCPDKAKLLIPPLSLRGTATELDNGFFEQITTPLQAASGLMVNMETYMAQVDEAKKHSAMEKEKAEKDKKEKDGKDKKYKDAMQKANELETEGKHREAWSKLPNPADFPEYADSIRKRRTELSNQFSPNLFGEQDNIQT